MLGTPSYGDGAGFLLLSRLVRALHREKGFSVLAWESGLYDCHVMRRKLADPERRTDEAASWGLHAVFGASAQCLPLVRYARESLGGERPLRFAGIDPQFTGRGSEEWLGAFLAWLDAPDGANLPDALRTGLEKARRRLDFSPFFPTEDQLERDREIVAAIERLVADPDGPWVRHHGATDVSFMLRTLRCFLVQAELRLRFRRPETRADGGRLRARTIADNLVWLATERHPDARIVVWIEASHAARRPTAVAIDDESVSFEGFRTAGDAAREAFGDRARSILVTAGGGAAAIVNQPPFDLPAPPPGSFEELALRTGEELLFVDLRAVPEDGPASFLRDQLAARPLSHRFGVARWPEICDGFLFVRTMTPSTLPADDDFGR
ncbi:MAG: erythromycin esterase family protein [Planctomycetota bacterium JB042]